MILCQGVFGKNFLPVDGPGAGHTSMLGGSHLFRTLRFISTAFIVFFCLFFMNSSALFVISSVLIL